MVGCIYRHFKGISIHASAKEATTVSSFSGVTEYFNPRLREGGDKEYHRNNGGKKNFNPRLREGGDGIQRHNRLEESKISIHASAKEATLSQSEELLTVLLFQSTPPRRRRQEQTLKMLLNQYFNPRLREGGDGAWFDNRRADRISIHASAKEATNIVNCLLKISFIFQSTPPRRRRPIWKYPLGGNTDFNPRLREGGDRNIL